MADPVNILITGATGFLGGHLVDACLREGHHVRALVREGSDTARLGSLPGVELALGDLTDEDSLRAAASDRDTVLHSAARVVDHGSRAQFHEANVAGTRRLMDAARAAGAGRFVFVSSPSALMRIREGDRLDIDESTPYPDRFFNLYCETKARAEQDVLAAHTERFTTVALRPRGIWGPRDHAGFLPRMVGAMRAGRLPDLSGGKRVLVSLCHSDNAVAACLRAAAAPSERVGGRAYFVADAERTDLWAFLTEVGRLLGCAPPGPRIPLPVGRALAGAVETLWRLRPGSEGTAPPMSRYMMALLTRSTTYDTGAARRDLGHEAPSDQAEGVRELVRWVQDIGGVDAWTRPGATPPRERPPVPDTTPPSAPGPRSAPERSDAPSPGSVHADPPVPRPAPVRSGAPSPGSVRADPPVPRPAPEPSGAAAPRPVRATGSAGGPAFPPPGPPGTAPARSERGGTPR
ncbi:NAD-dependent epimerase/dehydratase family protein [Streptomyces sp. NPDC059382]|uniref:NAD-dependent epimerase/dehydratase family protein n=1 Tax=Streptomyces sp. NPDC059382 TaxID=3346816 RepID=UPI00368884BD